MAEPGNKGSSHKQSGAPKGNRNALGNSGGAAPKGNHNAVGNTGGHAPAGNRNAITTGENDILLFDSFDETELSMVNGILPDEERLLLEEIKLLSVRERRMLKRIDDLVKKNPKGMTIQEIMTVSNTQARENSTIGRDTKTTKIEPVLNQIHKIEEALTRVQARKQVCIDMLYKMKNDKQKFELENW
jgi:uncharacterized protein YjcR